MKTHPFTDPAYWIALGLSAIIFSPLLVLLL